MAKELEKTTKARLREEFNTGDEYEVIADRLNAEGLGFYRVKFDDTVEWNKSNIGTLFWRWGWRRRGTTVPRKAPSRKAAATRKAPAPYGTDKLHAVKSLLEAESIDPEERIALALMALGG